MFFFSLVFTVSMLIKAPRADKRYEVRTSYNGIKVWGVQGSGNWRGFRKRTPQRSLQCFTGIFAGIEDEDAKGF